MKVLPTTHFSLVLTQVPVRGFSIYKSQLRQLQEQTTVVYKKVHHLIINFSFILCVHLYISTRFTKCKTCVIRVFHTEVDTQFMIT